MSASENRGRFSGALVAIAAGLIGGLLLVTWATQQSQFADRNDAELLIRINGLDQRASRDVLLPNTGWVLEVEMPEGLSSALRDTLSVTLRSERTGTTIEIEDQLKVEGRLASLVIPESLGLFAGLLSIRATLTDAEEHTLEAYRRVRIRKWLGGPPIGSRQIIHFDFTIDRDEDGRPDFEQDLEALGFASARPDHHPQTQRLAEHIQQVALARVARAYDPKDDPNHTRLGRDQVFVRFALTAEPSPFVTRICVGGENSAFPGSIGNVRFDHRNERRRGSECEGDPPTGLFPSEFSIYKEADLFRSITEPFRSQAGGTPLGAHSEDAAWLASLPSEGRPSPTAASSRAQAIERTIRVFGNALGTIMAHESAHALGLVPSGRPGVGLFGGEDGDAYAHNLGVDGSGNLPQEAWLMNPGRAFRFDQLSGDAEGGELRFRPLNHAYLKDRVVLVDARGNPLNPDASR